MSDLDSSRFGRFRQRLSEKHADVEARAVTYVAFGDSITQGFMEYDTVEHEQVFHHIFKRAVERQYPKTVLNVINAGVAGDSAHRSKNRWECDLFRYDPDLVTIGFGANDAHGGHERLPAYLEAVRELVFRIRQETNADMLLLIPGMMLKRDNPYVHPADRPHIPAFIQTYETGSLLLYRNAMLELAEQERIPHIDCYRMWEALEERGVDIHSRLANGINHPDREFHSAIADSMTRMIMQLNE